MLNQPEYLTTLDLLFTSSLWKILFMMYIPTTIVGWCLYKSYKLLEGR